ncbi:MAG: ferrous iron transport protein A [Promethearchaeota archaeon]
MFDKSHRKKGYIRHSKPLIKCLTECELGTELIVLGVNAGHGAKMRLAHLGIVPGVKIIKKKSAPFRGPINIIVKGTSLVLGRGLASKILVNCNNSCED